jgi:perosamine synthetase
MPRLPVAGPWITQREIDYVSAAAAHAWYEGANVYNERFERAFTAYLGVRHAVSLPSCTSAIHLALLALGVGAGDEVIVPDATWIASAAPISYVGATPVFADIDAQTWCLSAESFARCITSRTRAVIPVDLYGGVPDWGAIRELAERHGVAIIEDAAEAIGSEYRGRKAGSLGDVGVFSFHGSKTLTTGEGGMLVTDRSEVNERVRFLRDHGRPPGDRFFFNTEVAYKYKMSSLQAALGLAQLERIDELVDRKREIFGWYRRRLSGLAGVALNAEPDGTKNSYWMSTIVLDAAHGLTKAEFMARLDAQGIDSRPFFHPLSSIPAYAALPDAVAAARRNVVSYQIATAGVNLPSALSLTEAQVDRVCDAVREVLSEALRDRDAPAFAVAHPQAS